MSTIAVVVGNPKPKSRTRTIAEQLAERIAGVTGAAQQATVDLADYASEAFLESATVDELLRQIANADFAVIASPTYKASYTGLLKAFLDRYSAGGLAGVTAVPVFTIGSDHHALAVDFTLRPLLVELGASVPTAGLAFPTAKFDERNEILDTWLQSQRDALGHVTGERRVRG